MEILSKLWNRLLDITKLIIEGVGIKLRGEGVKGTIIRFSTVSSIHSIVTYWKL